MSKRKNKDNNDKENDPGPSDIKAKIAASNKRRKEAENLFIAFDMEQMMNKKIEKKEKQLQRQKLVSEAVENAPKIVESDGIFLEGLGDSVGTIIKVNAISKHPFYQQLDPNQQSIICLGLNSILDLSADFPESQSILFNKKQWHDLKRLFPPKLFNTKSYDVVGDILRPIFDAYDQKSPMKRNWAAMFKEILSLQSKHNAELDESFRDVDFCLYFFQSLLLLQKHHNYIFNENIDKSEWDFIVKFWGSVLEKLFIGTDLRLKWGDTVLTMKDVCNDSIFKVDLRVLNDKVVQRYNEEADVTVAEAAKNDPGTSKYQYDRCKLLSENKVIIDNFLHDTHEPGTVYSIQFCGLEMMIISLSLSANGLYVGNEIYHVQLDNSLQRFPIYLQTVLQLLCFRNEAIKVSNVRDNIKSTSTSKKTSVKGYNYNKSSNHEPVKSSMFSWTRGNWIPPRKRESSLPPIPTNLISQ